MALAVGGVVGDTAPAARLDRRFVAAFAAVVSSWRSPLACAAVVGMIDLLWATTVGQSFTGLAASFKGVAAFLFVGLTWQAGGILLGQRAGASRWTRRLQSLGQGTSHFGLWCAVALGALLLSYLSADRAYPFLDAQFAALDRSIGFDWPGWVRFVRHNPPLETLLSFTYRSHGAQLLLIFFVAAFSGDDRRGAECLWICTLGVIVACVVSTWVPAIGARVYFGLGTSVWVPDVTRLRATGSAVFEVSRMKGIVSMPSFHAALALIFMWSSRRTGIVGVGFIAFNAAMIVSTLSEGGHYLVDVIAGLALAAASIAVVHRLVYRDPSPDRATSASYPAV